MSISTRTFALDRTDSLHRISGAKFSAMLADPKTHLIPEFASQRIRVAEAAVELINRKPTAVVRMVFFLLGFDKSGALEVDAFMQQSAAVVDTLLVKCEPRKGNILDARSRLVVSGGRWKPTPAIQTLFHNAALGRVKCPSI